MTLRQQIPEKPLAVILLAAFIAAAALLDMFFVHFRLEQQNFEKTRLLKVAAYQKALASEENYDTWFVGSSRTNLGINTFIFDKMADTHSFNAGINGYAPVNLGLEVIEEIVTTKKPERIFYAIDSWSLSSIRRNRKIIDAPESFKQMFSFMNSYQNRNLFLYWAEKLLAGHWIRPADVFLLNLRDQGRVVEYEARIVHDHGHTEVFGVANPAWKSFFRDFKPLPDQLANLEKIIHLCRNHSVELVFIHLPEYEYIVEQFPSRYEKFNAFMTKIAAENHLHFIDFTYTDNFPDDDISMFFDSHHLNSAGAYYYSKLLAGHWLEPAGK